MKAALAWLVNLFVALAVGTFVTVVVLLAMLWWKGALGDERLLAMLAALQGIERAPAETRAASGTSVDAEQPSYEQVMQARLQASLDLDLRESAIDKALGDLRSIEEQIKAESVRIDHWTKDFDARLSKLETAATDAALLELQRTLEAIAPKQAKDQIMRMLDQPATANDHPMQDIVTIMKAMPLDKRRKILAEFKTPEEADKMGEILREIRIGTPDAELLRDTRAQLQQQQGVQP